MDITRTQRAPLDVGFDRGREVRCHAEAPRTGRRPVAEVVVALAAGVLGCATAAPPDTLRDAHGGGGQHAARLRVQVRSLANPFSGIVEGAADHILAHADTPAERIAGLRLKVDGVPAVQGALFDPDPVAAVFDTAALLVQAHDYIDVGAGTSLPPRVKEQALSAIAQMQQRLLLLGDQIGTSEDARARFWAAAESWAREHPIASTFTARESTQPLFADFMAREKGGLYSMAGRLEETAADMALRFDLYGEYIAKQVRWQGELLIEESLLRGVPRRTVEAVGTVPLAVAALPFDVDAQRDLVLAAARAERALLQDWLRSERVDTLEWAEVERQALAGALGKEREIVLAALRSEREATLATLREERAAMVLDLERLVAGALTSSRATVIDHFFLRLAQLLAVLIAAVFLAAWFLIHYARRPRQQGSA